MDAAMDPDVVTVAMIVEAQKRGLTWNQIAPAIGCPDGRAAKAKAHRIARRAQRTLLAGTVAEEDAG